MAYAITALLVLSFAGLPQTQPSGGEDTRRAIEHELMEEGIRDVQVRIANGAVELTGTVRSAWEKSRAEEIALDHQEVSSVDNRVVVDSTRSDAEIGDEVARQLRTYVHFTIFDDVQVAVKDGVVTLTGKVTAGYKAEEMRKMAARVPGVREAVSQIEVLPVSIHDEQLRGAIASRIYGDTMFQRYAIQADPPIHIIVDGGRVTLTGVVGSAIESRRAEQIARSTFGVFSVDNQLRVESGTSSP